MKCPKCEGTGEIKAATIGDRIEALCDAKGIPLAELERATGLAHTTLWRLMTGKGKKAGSLDTLVKIADYFAISLDDLIGRQEPIFLGPTQHLMKRLQPAIPNQCPMCGGPSHQDGLPCPALTPQSISGGMP
jgi:transcriptional regulator with XRE-family HTH domain